MDQSGDLRITADVLVHAARIIQTLDLKVLAIYDQIVTGLVRAVRECNFRALRSEHSGNHPLGDITLQLGDVAETRRVAKRLQAVRVAREAEDVPEVSDADKIKRVNDLRIDSDAVVQQITKGERGISSGFAIEQPAEPLSWIIFRIDRRHQPFMERKTAETPGCQRRLDDQLARSLSAG